MKKGFVTFCTEDYLCVLNNLLDSILVYSKYDVIVYTINFDYDFKSSRIKTKKIDLLNVNFFNICKMKIFSAIDCNLDFGLCIDTDMVFTKEIDCIFEENLDKILTSKFPLFGKHPHKPLQTNHGWMDAIKKYSNKLNENWVYATFIFSNENKWFLQEVLNEMETVGNQIGEDELIINGLLSKYGGQGDIGYNFFPNGLNEMFDIYFGLKEDNEINNPYLKYGCPVRFFAFHGHAIKNCDFGKELVKKLNI